MKSLALLVSISLLYSAVAWAQSDLLFSKHVKSVDIPFEYHNDLIIVTVTFNRVFPLKFIFDTGAEQTILARREITDLLHLPYLRELTLIGSDLKTEIKAYLVTNVHLKVGDWSLSRRPIIVLDEDYFRFEELTGRPIYGILGSDLFRHFVVEINFNRRIIRLTKASEFVPPTKGYERVSINVHRGKPYLDTEVRIFDDSPVPVRLLLDSGASLGLLLYTDTSPRLTLPPRTIKGRLGMGLGGFLEGYLGRVRRLHMGSNALQDVITNFQEVAVTIDSSLLFGRNGVIGNKVLSRFFLIIDYPREVMYLKPTRRIKEKFDFDKSGIVLISAGPRLRSITIHEVIEGSPAWEVGLKPGDVIVRVNSIPDEFMTIESLYGIFSKRAGKRIRMVVIRNGEKLKFTFRLRELI